MAQLTFFPSGDAGGTLIDLDDGKQILFDFADFFKPDDINDKRINLSEYLTEELKNKNRGYFDYVAFTHLDDDHIHGSSTFFEFEHSSTYQGDGRIKIKELWVPAAAIIEKGLTEESRLIRQEARHRLKQGSGIRVFSRPNLLEDWLRENELSLEDRKGLITDAGQLIPGFNQKNGVEIFVHSPFAKRIDENNVEERNRDSLVLHFSFFCDSSVTRFLLTSDITYDVLADIIRITKERGREERLTLDILDVPHHCSYTALSKEKGDSVTETDPDVNWLYREKGEEKIIIVSSSRPIPTNDDDPQPPHRQAASYYKDVAKQKNGEFVVTMEHQKISKPEPLVIEISSSKAKIRKQVAGGIVSIISSPAPRAG